MDVDSKRNLGHVLLIPAFTFFLAWLFLTIIPYYTGRFDYFLKSPYMFGENLLRSLIIQLLNPLVYLNPLFLLTLGFTISSVLLIRSRNNSNEKNAPNNDNSQLLDHASTE